MGLGLRVWLGLGVGLGIGTRDEFRMGARVRTGARVKIIQEQ